jgi:hypothetical protein
LTEITVALNNPAYSSEAGVLFDKNKATLVRYPEGKAGNSYTIPETVTSIGFYAFYSCSTLVSITITDNVIFLDHGAFQGCTNLESVFISPSSLLTSIGEMAFAGCNLRSITLPKSINSIGIWGFVACNSLIDVTVNWTATPPAIRSDVFFELTLADITLHIPNGTKAIYEAANIWKEFNIVERPPVGIEGIPPATGLKAYVQNGVLRVSGLAAGEVLSVYDASGKRVYQGEAARVPLAVRGMYIIRTETRSVRVVY